MLQEFPIPFLLLWLLYNVILVHPYDRFINILPKLVRSIEMHSFNVLLCLLMFYCITIFLNNAAEAYIGQPCKDPSDCQEAKQETCDPYTHLCQDKKIMMDSIFKQSMEDMNKDVDKKLI